MAAKENVREETLADRVASGRVVIPANRLHSTLDPVGIGEGLRTKINVNVGLSPDSGDLELELSKARRAQGLAADSIMDLSCEGQSRDFRRRLVAEATCIVGSVPAYDVPGSRGLAIDRITASDWLAAVEVHAKDGVDFVTIHAGMTREVARLVRESGRIMNLVSRGGSLLFDWMESTGEENPFYAGFDQLLDLCEEYDVTLSLGDAGRPGCVHDATDAVSMAETIILGGLTQRARNRGVQILIEGPGHMAIDEVAANVVVAKRLCHGAPFYVLGPLVTDVAPGYDHITAAIGAAVAAAAGADFLCTVTPAEHLRLPTLDDIREGIVSARIAAHAGDLAKRVPNAHGWDERMSRARRELDWEQMCALAIDPDKPRRYREESRPCEEETCTMCGRLCAVRTMNRALARSRALDGGVGSSAANARQRLEHPEGA